MFDIYFKHAEIGYNQFALTCIWCRHIWAAGNGLLAVVKLSEINKDDTGLQIVGKQ